MDSAELKRQLLLRCLDLVEQKIGVAKQAMNFAQESANQEEKSSAGDKYETGRAMAQIARDQAAQQLDEALKLKTVLDQINPNHASVKVESGAVVITDQNRFYISISLGQLEINGETFIAISPQSAIGKRLMNQEAGEVITFNNQTQTIINIY